jgi:hypothetical protein
MTTALEDDADLDAALTRARDLMAAGDDTAAKQAYVEILHRDPTHFAALNELAALAHAGGYRSAARRAYLQAVEHHPDNPIGRINLANLLLEAGEAADAKLQLQAVLALDPDLAEAHQGLARALAELGDDAAEQHWRKGFARHAIVTRPYRGKETGIRLLLLVAARGGNIPTQQWIDDRTFAITAVYCDFHDTAQPLPPELTAPFGAILNAIGDADICDEALAGAERLLAQLSGNPAHPRVINLPARVRQTGRAAIASRLAGLAGVVVPEVRETTGTALLVATDLQFPLLLRKPGFHTGRHFHYVEGPAGLKTAIAELPPGDLLAIEYLDARGPDGMARKYRVMFIGGIAYPLHLAISTKWKVHYFTADMAANLAHRAEEERFLRDMPAVLGPRAMQALTAIQATLGLDYAGIDFALSADGSLLLFEANATMVINPPDPDPTWDYRRSAINKALAAAKDMLLRHGKALSAR